MSRAQARRIALAAQGFLDPRHATPTCARFTAPLARTGVLQIDSVNVLQRAHYMPLFSRMGPYDTALLRPGLGAGRRAGWWSTGRTSRRSCRSTCGRTCSTGWRHYRDGGHAVGWTVATTSWSSPCSPRCATRGPQHRRATSTTGCPARKDHWGWNWSETKKALEYLFLAGELAVAGRNAQFERLYDLPERVAPARRSSSRPSPTDEEAHRELVRRAAIVPRRGHGADLRDYYRMRVADGPAGASPRWSRPVSCSR